MRGNDRPAVFLDRDGTLIRDVGYLAEPEHIEFLDGCIWGLQELERGGFAFAVISNQSGIGRGLISSMQVDAVNQSLIAKLGELGINVEGIYYCPHAPWNTCICRKPSPEMVFRAAREHDLDLKHSVFVGNEEIDVQTGRNAGIRTVLLDPASEGGAGVARDWAEIVRWIFVHHEFADLDSDVPSSH